MIDSGSVVSLITKTLAKRTLRTTPFAKWISTKQNRDLKTFSNETIKVLGQLSKMVIYNNWTCKKAHLTVVEDGHKIIIGRDLLTSLGLAIVQQQPESVKCVSNINNSTCKTKDTMAAQFPHLVSRIGLSDTHVAKSKFHEKFTTMHQKVRRVLINLQPRVTAELDC